MAETLSDRMPESFPISKENFVFMKDEMRHGSLKDFNSRLLDYLVRVVTCRSVLGDELQVLLVSAVSERRFSLEVGHPQVGI